MPSLKIISLNTWKCDGEYEERIGYMASELEKIKPDIITLQECFRTEDGETDTLGFLGSKLQMKSNFIPGRFKKRLFNQAWVDSYSDLGILTRYPFSKIKEYSLPGVPKDPDRKVQMASIDLPGSSPFLLVNTHLTHISTIPNLKKSQLDGLSDFIQKNLNDYPFALVCGDFNSLIDSEELVEFISKNQAIDSYKAGNGQEPRNSLVDAFKVGKNYAVDHIFYIPNPKNTLSKRFIESKMVLNIPEPYSGIYPSDHFGIFTHIEF